MARVFNSSSADDAHSNVDLYPANVPRHLTYPDIPAFGLLARAARLQPGRLACHYNQVEWTWEELDLDSMRAARALLRLGVQPGDRVGILLPNIPEYIIALNGIWRAGAIAVALSPLSVPQEVDGLLEATQCRVVICLDMLASLISGDHRPDKTLFISLRPRLPLFEQLGYLFLRRRRTGHWWLSANEHVGWFWDELFADEIQPDRSPETLPEILRRRITGVESELSTHSPRAGVSSHSEGGVTQSKLPAPDWASKPAYILPTGGTTGEPKAVTLSHRNLVANAWQQYYWAGSAIGRETMLAVLPFFHSYGLSANVMAGTAMAASLIMDHRFSARRVVRLIERHRPTVFHAVPAMLAAINEYLNQRTADLTSLKWVISGGAPLPEAIGRTFAARSGALVVEGFGLSEASPVTHVGPLNSSARFGTIGLPLPDTECRVVDINTGTIEVPQGDIGELLVRGPQVMLGYWEDVRRQKTPAGPTDDGWLHTGDLVRLRPNGLFEVVERKKDLIITSGFNVYPQEVEAVLMTHPSVAGAAVVGVPDSQRGESVKAFVVLDKNCTVSLSDLMTYCRTHLAAHKRPRDIEICEQDLPRSFLGKVIRRKLRESEGAAS